MDLRELRYFTVAAEMGNLSKAAEHLRIAQPALGRQIQKLEDELGVVLLERHSRGVTLTDAGLELMDRATELLLKAGRLKQAVTERARGSGQSVRLGMAQSAIRLLVPQLVAEFQQRFPNVRLGLIEGSSEFLAGWFNSGRVDIAIGYMERTQPELHVEPLLIEKIFLICPASDRQRTDMPARFSVNEIARLPLVLPSGRRSVRPLIEATLAKQGLKLKPPMEADGMVATKTLVAAGHGYGLLAYRCVIDEVASGELHAVPTEGLHWNLDLVTRRELMGERSVVELIALIRRLLKDLIDRDVWRGALRLVPRS